MRPVRSADNQVVAPVHWVLPLVTLYWGMSQLVNRELPSVRERLEQLEEVTLASYAAHSAHSKGRARPEEPSPVRTEYQRDRDRIVHTNAFRRLRGKTQVFIAPSGDHYATRLSHVIEVAQVARVIARALRLNEDLAEAVALAHDLGHAPFGHAGQEALDHLLGGGYRHDEQSLRVVEYLEKDGLGLNLEGLDRFREKLFASLNGIIHRSPSIRPVCRSTSGYQGARGGSSSAGIRHAAAGPAPRGRRAAG